MTRTGRQILVVSPHVPAPWFGSGTRIYQLVRQLAMRHQVTVVCPAAPGEEVDVEQLRSLGVKVQAVAVTSDRELPVVRDHAPQTAAAVVPNAVDPAYFTPGTEEAEAASILFMGTLKYRPNVDAVTFLLDEVLPEVQRRRPDAVLTVVGDGDEADLNRFRRPGVVVTGRVPDVRPYLARAAVTVVPVRIGGGTRLKV